MSDNRNGEEEQIADKNGDLNTIILKAYLKMKYFTTFRMYYTHKYKTLCSFLVESWKLNESQNSQSSLTALLMKV